jgi:hypothetical protein
MPPKLRKEVGEAASATCKCKKYVCNRCWKCVSCPGGCKCSPEKVVRKKRASIEYIIYAESPANTVKERHAKIARETNHKPAWESANMRHHSRTEAFPVLLQVMDRTIVL